MHFAPDEEHCHTRPKTAVDNKAATSMSIPRTLWVQDTYPTYHLVKDVLVAFLLEEFDLSGIYDETVFDVHVRLFNTVSWGWPRLRLG